MNVVNARSPIQQNEMTGPSFNLRLPVEIQDPRQVRFRVKYEF